MPLPGTPSAVDPEHLIHTGFERLQAHQWMEARDAFQHALALNDSAPEAWEGLAASAHCLDDLETSRTAYDRAYRVSLTQQNFPAAARAAMQLALYHEIYHGESGIANGWFERARSLLERIPEAAEHAWLAFYQAHVQIHIRGDIAEGQRNLDTAVRLGCACKIGDEFDLIVRGLRGLLAVHQGDVSDGLTRLDETTAAMISGELREPLMVGWSFCYILEACENVRDFGRATQWLQRAWPLEHEFGIAHHAGFCRGHQVAVLTWRAAYAEAEEQIETMRRELEHLAPAWMPHCDIRLGEIRRRQGRSDEAAALLEPHASDPLAMWSLGALALDTHRPQIAADLFERCLRRLSPSERMRRFHAVELLTCAHSELHDQSAAWAALDELDRISGHSGTPLMRAIGKEARGVAVSTFGDLDEARRLLEDAVDGHDAAGVPYEATVARLRLADVLLRVDRRDAARQNVETALSTAEHIGAERLVQSARAVLARLRTTDAPPSSTLPGDPANKDLPDRIGHYAIVHKIGEGGMGVVFAATDERLERSVALKTMSSLGNDETARKRFWREARAAASVNHPNVCQIYEIGEDAGELFIAMELLEGESLVDRLRRGPLSVSETVPVALGVLSALSALHARGIVHRDLKPSNVFLTQYGVKLLDFGLARPEVEPSLRSTVGLTRTGIVMGTPQYMAPEQVTGESVDARSDLFAAGAIMFELLAGRPAFGGRNVVEILHATLYEHPPALTGSPAVAAVDRVIRHALAKRPADRPASADAMAEELREVRGLEGT